MESQDTIPPEDLRSAEKTLRVLGQKKKLLAHQQTALTKAKALLDTVRSERELLPGLTESSLKKDARILHIDEPSPAKNRTCLLIKNWHGGGSDLRNPSREYLGIHLAHQQHTLNILQALLKSPKEKNIRVVLEARNTDGSHDFIDERSRYFINSSEIDKQLSLKSPEEANAYIMGLLHRNAHIPQNKEAMAYYIGAESRFFTRCFLSKRSEMILAGTPLSDPGNFHIQQAEHDLNTLVNAPEVSDALLENILSKWRENRDRDHKNQHAFVHEQVMRKVPTGGSVAIVFGGMHMQRGTPMGYPSHFPLDEYFSDCRRIIVEVHQYDNILEAQNNRSSGFILSKATVEYTRQYLERIRHV